jgi:hypothetical protein
LRFVEEGVDLSNLKFEYLMLKIKRIKFVRLQCFCQYSPQKCLKSTPNSPRSFSKKHPVIPQIRLKILKKHLEMYPKKHFKKYFKRHIRCISKKYTKKAPQKIPVNLCKFISARLYTELPDGFGKNRYFDLFQKTGAFSTFKNNFSK